MVRPKSITDWIEYLEYMIDFYFKVIIALGYVGFKAPFREQMSCSLQMMFTKAKSMRRLLDGYHHREGDISLNWQTDHTILFTLVRAAYEQLCTFELVYMIPDTEEKRSIMENVYVAAGQVNRLKMLTEEEISHNPEETVIIRQDIENCRAEIQNTSLYQSLKDKEKAELEKHVFKNGEFQIIFTKDGRLDSHVGWDEVRNYCHLRTDALHGVYRYVCNMAHPSYIGLIQFHDAYNDGAIIQLNETAIMQMIAIMSVYIMDFMDEFPEAKHVYEALDDESQFVIRMYSESFRKSSKLS